MQNPAEDSRGRYNQAFTSKIFEPENPRLSRSFVPAGKRRDQSTNEMFGTYEDKELYAMPKTFVPKDDPFNARQKKQQFLTSDVLPHTVYSANAHPPPPQQPQMHDAMMPHDCEDGIDPIMRRQQELSSELFGRGSPEVSHAEAHDMSRRLAPNDFKWYSHPEGTQSPTGNIGTYKDRSYHEKSSNVFEHKSPEGRWQQQREADQQAKMEDQDASKLRRADAYYSDMFGRASEPRTTVPPGEDGQRRHKKTGDAANRIVVHQDWTDSKTEIMGGARGGRDQAPAERRAGELHQSRVFESDEAPSGEFQTMAVDRNSARMSPVTTDNSSKLRRTYGQTTQDVHQAHLRTSLAPDGFYEDVQKTKHWEVVELHVSGLPSDADEPGVRRLCAGFDLQVVKISVETDPVRNLCKGRARICIRYNPERDSMQHLVQKLEDNRLRVEL